MNKSNNLPKATQEQIERFDALRAEMDNIERSGLLETYDRYSVLHAEFHSLIEQYDWSDEVFEENGKKGVRNIKGEILVPAMYDEFAFTGFYYSHVVNVAAIKDGKMGLVKYDGTGTLVTDFEYSDIDLIPHTSKVYAVKTDADPKHFALLIPGVMRTPFELDKYYEICDNNLFVDGDGKHGVYDISSGVYVAPEYDDIEFIDSGENYIFVKDGVKGYLALDKRFISLDDYENLSDEEYDKWWETGFIRSED